MGCFTYAALLAIAAAAAYYPVRQFAAGRANPFANEDLTGKVALVTGANTGIGWETAKQLYIQNADVVLACRSKTRCEHAMANITAQVPGGVGSLEVSLLDLNDFDSVRAFASRWGDRPLHLLINNAGIMALPQHTLSPSGVEMQMNVNHMGHFLLTGLLLPNLRASAPARVVDVSSRAGARLGQHLDVTDLGWTRRDYNMLYAYGASKMANVLHAKELTRLMAAEGVDVTAYSLHPGVIHTELMRNVVQYHWSVDLLVNYIAGPLVSPLLKTPVEGAQTTLYLATAPHAALGTPEEEAEVGGAVIPGAYYDDCALVKHPVPMAYDAKAAADLWAASEGITGWKYEAPEADAA